MMIIMVRDGKGWLTRWGLISYLLVDYGWSVGQKIVVDISNLSYVVSGSLLKHTKFLQNRTKNRVRNFLCCSVLVGRAGRSKNGRRHFKFFLSCFCSIFSPHTKFYLNRTKNTEVRNFHFWSILVGRAGRSKNGRRHIKLILCCFCPIISPNTKFHPDRMKNTEVENFHFWSVLVGRAGRSKNGCSYFKHSIAV